MTGALFNRQISAAQSRQLSRYTFDAAYTRAMAAHPSNACMSDWLPGGTGEKLLELGCGPGKYVAMLSTLGYRVTGVDPLEFPTWKVLREGTSAELLPGIRAERLPFPDASFDHAVCLGALLYFDDPERALRELRRVVKPGGKVIIRSVNRDNLYTRRTGRKLDPASKQLYTLAELTELIDRCGFRAVRAFAHGFWPPFWTDFWWYLVSVWLSVDAQNYLSSKLRPEYRVNNVVFAFCDQP